MHLKNNAARLITVCLSIGGSEKSFAIAPGDNPAVEVPDSATELDFVKALIGNGSLIEVIAPKDNSAKTQSKTKKSDE